MRRVSRARPQNRPSYYYQTPSPTVFSSRKNPVKHYIDKESWINRLWQTGNVFCIIALIGLTGAWFLSELLELTFEELANILSFDNTAPYV